MSFFTVSLFEILLGGPLLTSRVTTNIRLQIINENICNKTQLPSFFIGILKIFTVISVFTSNIAI